ncbi:mediator of RNA polymerase II transcription subunit 1.1-like isoform X2 [Ornithodoros turicata]
MFCLGCFGCRSQQRPAQRDQDSKESTPESHELQTLQPLPAPKEPLPEVTIDMGRTKPSPPEPSPAPEVSEPLPTPPPPPRPLQEIRTPSPLPETQKPEPPCLPPLRRFSRPAGARIQRQASVCLSWYEVEPDAPQCSHWSLDRRRQPEVDTSPRRLSVPTTAKLLPVESPSEGWKEVPSPILHESSSTETPGFLEKGLEKMARRLLKSRSLEEEPSPPPVLYNDTGSKEDVREEALSSPCLSESDQSEDAETVRMQYRQLWELRATFEEEEETDSRAFGQDSSSQQSLPHSDHVVVVEEHVETPPASEDEKQQCGFNTSLDSEPADEGAPKGPPGRLLGLPTSGEVRRHNYKILLARRLQRRTESSADNSFDSMETDCSSTDASRTEGVTTSSFDSTTDNTDGGESQAHHRLQQMKADSGYRSMESTNGNKPPKLSRKHVGFPEGDPAEPSTSTTRRSALKKRRQFEGRQPSSDDSAAATSTDAVPELPEASYYDVRGKISVFHRFFRSSRRSRGTSKRILIRDYSIDPKTDALFKEFSRQDPVLESETGGSSPRLSSSKLLSPQLSIEEEEGSDESHSAMEDDWRAEGPCCDAPIVRLPPD